MKNVTIQDIANAAGVSKSTVSRVLNGKVAVNAEKKKAVLEATKRLGFRPNIVAQSLARGRSMTVGVVTQLVGSPFYDTIVEGVIAGLQGTNYSPVFVDGQLNREEELAGIRTLIGRQVDGLVLIAGKIPGTEIADLCRDIPKVIIARELPSDVHHCVSVDNVDGGYQVTKYLLENGHRKIALISGTAEHPDTKDRLRGYQKALGEYDLETTTELLLDGDFTASSGERCMERLLASGQEFSAVFAMSDRMAFGARLALFKNGLRVPDDISLIGFDDQIESAYMTPPLTTFRQPAKEMGEAAVKDLLCLMADNDAKPFAAQSELIVRESVGKCKKTGLSRL